MLLDKMQCGHTYKRVGRSLEVTGIIGMAKELVKEPYWVLKLNWIVYIWAFITEINFKIGKYAGVA